MRNPTLRNHLAALTLAACSASATPIQVVLEGGEPDGIGHLAFRFDPVAQPAPPFAFADAFEFEGDYLLKEDPYRIHVEDFFQVSMEGWSGYGFNWLLETWPRDGGIFEQYCEVRFFRGLDEALVLQGAWSSYWTEETPLFATLDRGGERVNEDRRIASLELATVPEPPTAALFAGVLLLAGIFSLFRRWSPSASPTATKTSWTNARWTPSARAGRAANTSTRPKAPSGSGTCPPASRSSARTIAAST
jgi:hypothetical protein